MLRRKIERSKDVPVILYLRPLRKRVAKFVEDGDNLLSGYRDWVSCSKFKFVSRSGEIYTGLFAVKALFHLCPKLFYLLCRLGFEYVKFFAKLSLLLRQNISELLKEFCNIALFAKKFYSNLFNFLYLVCCKPGNLGQEFLYFFVCHSCFAYLLQK